MVILPISSKLVNERILARHYMDSAKFCQLVGTVAHYQTQKLIHFRSLPCYKPSGYASYFYRPQTKLGQGNVFTPVCPTGGGGVMMSLPVMDSTPPPAKDSTHSAKDSTGVCCSGGAIWGDVVLSRGPQRSTSGRYASYSNAFLMMIIFEMA